MTSDEKKKLGEQYMQKHADAWQPLHWRAWGSWFSWGSPIGLGIFLLALAGSIWILAQI